MSENFYDPCAEIPDLPESDEARRARETKEELRAAFDRYRRIVDHHTMERATG